MLVTLNRAGWAPVSYNISQNVCYLASLIPSEEYKKYVFLILGGTVSLISPLYIFKPTTTGMNLLFFFFLRHCLEVLSQTCSVLAEASVFSPSRRRTAVSAVALGVTDGPASYLACVITSRRCVHLSQDEQMWHLCFHQYLTSPIRLH